jgi:hypothetical protein
MACPVRNNDNSSGSSSTTGNSWRVVLAHALKREKTRHVKPCEEYSRTLVADQATQPVRSYMHKSARGERHIASEEQAHLHDALARLKVQCLVHAHDDGAASSLLQTQHLQLCRPTPASTPIPSKHRK